MIDWGESDWKWVLPVIVRAEEVAEGVMGEDVKEGEEEDTGDTKSVLKK